MLDSVQLGLDWGSYGEQGFQGSCNQLPQVWPMSLHAALLADSKGIETPLPITPPKPPTGWDAHWLGPNSAPRQGSALGPVLPRVQARPSLNLLFHPVSSWCPLFSGSADNQVLGTKLFPLVWILLFLSPPPFAKVLLIQRTEGSLEVTLTPTGLK